MTFDQILQFLIIFTDFSHSARADRVSRHWDIQNMTFILSDFDHLLTEELYGSMAMLWSADSMIMGLNPSLGMIFHFARF